MLFDVVRCGPTSCSGGPRRSFVDRRMSVLPHSVAVVGLNDAGAMFHPRLAPVVSSPLDGESECRFPEIAPIVFGRSKRVGWQVTRRDRQRTLWGSTLTLKVEPPGPSLISRIRDSPRRERTREGRGDDEPHVRACA